MRIAMTICALLALVATAGCGGGKKTVNVGDASVTTSDDGKSTTIAGPNGTISIGGGSADASKLGAPVYPGATQNGDGTGGYAVTTAEGSNDTAIFKTTDPFDAVYAFYKSKLPDGSEKLKMEAAGKSFVTFQTGDASNDSVTVMVTGKDGETDITIAHTIKTGAATDASSAPSDAPSAAPSDGGGS